MFTGIIQYTAPVVYIDQKLNFRTHVLEFPQELLLDLQLGASVAHNGCCLTVTQIRDHFVSFDLIQETIKLTNLGTITVGCLVNIERAVKFNDEIGGHFISGHIICTATIIKILISDNNYQIWCKILDSNIMKYFLHKGFVSIDGISLTISKVTKNYFCVHLIPETLLRTTLGLKRSGDRINIEIDRQTQAIVDTVERLLINNNKYFKKALKR
ncbi:Riboflavin synthase [Candidatus Profftia lariciata]|uniref:riboflavin synthase subunit alpha n=1 Tax=Candidatus Profftia lariciata TaxID=1987921 RepID=UPI001D01D2BE|nr:riboflavin synthase subunit alpha [Candidatus Profftia lariciata]UDG81712.1 Riboflavin synthase [Candidatus Profftia lariciata]